MATISLPMETYCSRLATGYATWGSTLTGIQSQVEDVQYRLHRSLLGKHSPVFRELFTIPQPEGSTEGCSEENPIVLSGIQAANFTRFLSLLYPPYVYFFAYHITRNDPSPGRWDSAISPRSMNGCP